MNMKYNVQAREEQRRIYEDQGADIMEEELDQEADQATEDM
ncbi:MAG: hypothetical protein ACLUT4_13475 [Lachnospiraceae bacterium]